MTTNKQRRRPTDYAKANQKAFALQARIRAFLRREMGEVPYDLEFRAVDGHLHVTARKFFRMTNDKRADAPVNANFRKWYAAQCAALRRIKKEFGGRTKRWTNEEPTWMGNTRETFTALIF